MSHVETYRDTITPFGEPARLRVGGEETVDPFPCFHLRQETEIYLLEDNIYKVRRMELDEILEEYDRRLNEIKLWFFRAHWDSMKLKEEERKQAGKEILDEIAQKKLELEMWFAGELRKELLWYGSPLSDGFDMLPPNS